MERGAAEEQIGALEAEVRRLRLLLESAPDFIMRLTPGGQLLDVNRVAPGFELEQVLGTSVDAYLPPESVGAAHAAMRAACETRCVQEYTTAGQLSAGRVGHYLTRVSPVIEDGEVTSLVMIATDVTALREQRILLQVALDATDLGFWTFKPAENTGTWDATMRRIFGLSEDEPAPPTAVFLERHVFAEDRHIVVEALTGALGTGRFGPVKYRIVRPGGEVRWISGCGLSVKNPLGETVLLVGSTQDITERRALEARLLEAQKLESIGRLAGGVAHDFNNMLTAMLGNIDFAAEAPSLEDVMPHLVEIRRSAERSAALTSQLLAFARRQMIMPKVLDPNALLGRVESLVRRVIGEQLRVTLRFGAQGLVRVDESQLEQVIMNLVTNARDAMVTGGTLHLETSDELLEPASPARPADVAPGRYVAISVEDDGPGIPAESLPHIFEPFYTTRAGGTGLGLATCYGIVQQNGGHIVVSSQPGKGTTFRVYLPSVDTTPSNVLPAPETSTVPVGERVLLVEDEPAVRAMVERSLRRNGYSVHSAPTAEDALKLVASEAPFALLVTDVVLPGMNGRDLSRRLAEHSPELRVLFISGYTQNMIEQDGVLDSSIHFLQKPFLPAQLAAAARKVLASPKHRR